MLDPHRARTFVGRIVFTSLCDKLIDITPELEFVPQLATEWSWSDDGTTLTMKLREGVTFHDGEPFDAEAVKANIDRARTLARQHAQERAGLGRKRRGGRPDDGRASSCRRADATLLAQLADRAGMMLSPKAARATDFGGSPVCSGPYRFVERVQNDRIVLEKYADYGDADELQLRPRGRSCRFRTRPSASPICRPAISRCWSGSPRPTWPPSRATRA